MPECMPCSHCGKTRKVELVERDEQVTIKGREVTFSASCYRCTSCGEELLAPGQLDANLSAAREVYARLYDTPGPEALVALRAKYNAGQKAFGMILGFGELTMNSYEQGGSPDPTNRLLLKLAAEPQLFKAMYDINKSRIGAIQRQRIEGSEGFVAALRLTRRAGWTTMKPIRQGFKAAKGTNMNVLTLDSVIDKIRHRKDAFERDYGVKRIGVFGSVARNEANEMSDVDIVVEMTDPDLFYLVHIKDTLSEDLERPVDIVSLRETMNVYLKNRIQNEAVYA